MHQNARNTADYSSSYRQIMRGVLAGLVLLGFAMSDVSFGQERNPQRKNNFNQTDQTEQSETNSAAEPAPETESLSKLRRALYTEVNRARSSVGARRVKRDTGFEAIAREHARDMVARTYMSHRSPEGDGPRERVLAKFPDFIGIAGENIAMRSIRPNESVEDTALAAVEAWIDSAPHRKNLYDQRHGHVGLAAAENGRAIYIVMLLASEPSLRPPPPKPEPQDAPNPDNEAPPAGSPQLDELKPAQNKEKDAAGS